MQLQVFCWESQAGGPVLTGNALRVEASRHCVRPKINNVQNLHCAQSYISVCTTQNAFDGIIQPGGHTHT